MVLIHFIQEKTFSYRTQRNCDSHLHSRDPKVGPHKAYKWYGISLFDFSIAFVIILGNREIRSCVFAKQERRECQDVNGSAVPLALVYRFPLAVCLALLNTSPANLSSIVNNTAYGYAGDHYGVKYGCRDWMQFR